MGAIISFVFLAIHYTGLLIEIVGILVVAISVFIALWQLILRLDVDKIRTKLARNVIFGLEFVIAADILLVAVANNLSEIIQLGGIVIIRVLLGYAMHKEIFKANKTN
jgi:uncharacterized membrane protein